MKITKVTIQNINSLQGKNIIDFKSDFSNHGLFLITGDTGSGKSTILDAICVALYGRTPRLGIRGGETKHLFALKTDSCFSEVEFEVDSVLYKSYWGLDRVSRGKNKGDIKDSVMKLAIYKNNAWESLDIKKSDITKKIEEITNLNFDRFTKTVMLAQGSFDAFLKADKSEKSEILEKITGTQIYQKISQRVFEKNRSKVENLNRLKEKIDESKVLNDEQLEEKQSSIKTNKDKNKLLSKELKDIQAILTTITNIAKYQKDIETLNSSKLQLNNEKKEFIAKQKQLENALKAKEIYSKIVDKDNLVKENTLRKEELESLNKNSLDFGLILTNIKTNIKKADDINIEFQKEYKTKTKTLEKARELITINDIHNKELKKLERNIKQYENIEKDIKKYSDTIKLNTNQLENSNELLEKDKIEFIVVTKKLDELKKMQFNFLKIKDYAKDRINLKIDEECPLCGSKEHPYSTNIPNIDDDLTKDIDTYNKKFKHLNKSIEVLTQKNHTILTSIEVLKVSLNKALEDKQKLKKETDETKFILEKDIKDINEKIKILLENKDIVLFIKEIEDKKSSIENRLNTLQKEQIDIDTTITKNSTNIKNTNENITQVNTKLLEITKTISTLIEQKKFKDEDDVKLSYIKDETILSSLQKEQTRLKDKEIEIVALLKSSSEKLEEELKKDIDKTITTEELEKRDKDLTSTKEELIKTITLVENEIKQSADIKKEQNVIYQQINKTKEDLIIWEKLNDLIGKADGGKYQAFVQNLTLGHLLKLANNHLKYLNDRYILKKENDENLTISIIDSYYFDEVRSTNTLSGGEGFLVSLALALGLSDLVNDRIRVDSLFLDEGFGTLDIETLNTAIDALEKLHLKGKMIGIISHVEVLKERIYAQIQLKKNANGHSDLTIVK